MSWSDLFPIYDDVPSGKLNSVIFKSKKLMGEKYRNVTTRHLVAASLFVPALHSKLQLLHMAERVKSSGLDVVVRIYLSEDLEEEAIDFLELGCEVELMELDPKVPSMGRLWPFLALEENKLVTVTEAGRLDEFLTDVEQTERVARSELGGWRVPAEIPSRPDQTGYRPMNPCYFGCCRSYPVRELMEAFVTDSLSGSFQPVCHLPWGGELGIAASTWAEEGFESWFLMAVLYPRMAADGLVTILPGGDSRDLSFLPLDIEYCT